MRDIAIVSIVAIIALLGLVLLGMPAKTGAFVTRPTIKIVEAMSYDSVGSSLCTGSRGQCMAPSCPTGLAHVKMPGDIAHYQWMVIPKYMVGQQIGGCCEDRTSLVFQAQEMDEYMVMRLTCDSGRWMASFV